MYLSRFLKPRQRRIYLDMAAATPVRKEVMKVMHPYFGEVYGNPSAIHREGVVAKQAVEAARESVAELLQVRSAGVYFTGSGTEANNMALYGRLRYVVEEQGRRLDELEIISTKLEHPSVSRVLEHVATQGVTVRFLDVDETGTIDVRQLESLLSARTVVVSTHYVNSEVGTIQPVGQIARAVKKFNQANSANVLVHIDAAQAPLWVPCEIGRLGIDMMTLDAGKCFGPKGVGVLATRHGVALKGVVLGGGQEAGLRAGTENVPLIVGAAKAFELAQGNYVVRASETSALRDHFIEMIRRELPQAILNGPVGERRVANNVNISIPGLDTEFAVVVLDTAGIAASTKSACSGAGGGESVVVKTISGDAARAASTLRFTLGSEVTTADLDKVVRVLKIHIEKQAIDK